LRRKKREILSGIKDGRFCTIEEPPTLSTGEFWLNLFLIKDSNVEYEPFVQCITCQQILSYEAKTGTNSLNIHLQNWINKISVFKPTMPIDNFI
jgi:hypothetical protein